MDVLEKTRHHVLSKPSNLQRVDFVRTEFNLWLDPGETVEDVKSPKFWAHHHMKLRPQALVEVRHRDGSYFGIFLVLAVGEGWVKVHPILEVPIVMTTGKATVPATYDDYKVDQTGDGWRVVHRKTSRALVKGLPHEQMARDFVEQEIAKQA